MEFIDVSDLIPFFSAILFLVSGIGVFLIIMLFRFRSSAGGLCLLMTLACLVLWAFFQGLELLPFSSGIKVILSQLSYLGIAPLTTFFFLFVYHYFYQIDWKSNRWGKWLLAEPIAILVLVFTNSFHGWVWSGFSVSASSSFLLIYHHGPAVVFHAVYTYCIVAGSLFLLLKFLISYGAINRKSIILLMLACFLPMTGNIAYIFKLTPLAGIDYTPMLFLISGTIIGFIFLRYHFFELKPVAYEWLFSSINEGIIVFDNENRLTMINPMASQWIGSSKHIKGKTLWELSFLDRALHEIVPEGFSGNIEFTFSGGHHELWLQLEWFSLKNTRQHKIGHVLKIRNITEKKLQEEKTKTNHIRQQALLDNLPFMVWLKDLEGRYLAINREFRKKAGLPYKEIIGKSDLEIWPKKMAIGEQMDDILVIQSGKRKIVEENIRGEKGGLWVEKYKSPIFNENGIAEGITGMSQDITQRKQLETLKGNFISMVSHELRTPLTCIISSLSLLKELNRESFSDTDQKVMDICYRNAERLVRFVNEILDFEKIRQDGVKLNITPEDLSQLIEEALESLVPLAREKGLDLHYCTGDALPKAQLDKDRITQVVNNLVQNAIKYTEKGSIKVSALFLPDADSIRVQIVDTGIGIHEKDLQSIFHLFVQAAPLEYQKLGSSGLGLAIAQEIIKRHSGKIWAKSEFGKGSTFYFQIPCRQRHLDEVMDSIIVQ